MDKTLNKLTDSHNLKSSDFKSYISKCNEYLSTLTSEQVPGLANIILLLTILLALLNLITVFYSHSLIKHYNLELKYPRLAKFILLRSSSIILLITV